MFYPFSEIERKTRFVSINRHLIVFSSVAQWMCLCEKNYLLFYAHISSVSRHVLGNILQVFLVQFGCIGFIRKFNRIGKESLETNFVIIIFVAGYVSEANFLADGFPFIAAVLFFFGCVNLWTQIATLKYTNSFLKLKILKFEFVI